MLEYAPMQARLEGGTYKTNGKRRWKKQNPEYTRDYYLKKTYGLTATQYDAMLQEQAGLCAMCSRSAHRLEVDHDHATGEIRALLCRQCNWALAIFRDDPEVAARLYELAAAYLAKHRSPYPR